MASYTQSGWFLGGIRLAVSAIDMMIYNLISVLYQIFFNVSNATLISGETMKAFYSRIQLILGIFIMFKLAISLINGIMNPDSIGDDKKGFFGIVKRIVIALIMLVLIIPLNIPTSDLGEDGSYNSQLNNNGILFGTLYEFQRVVLSQNTLARLILGVSSDTTSTDISNSSSQAGNELASIILKCFVTINTKSDNGDPMKEADRMCQDSDLQEYILDYLDPTITPGGILVHINEDCKVKDNEGIAEIEEGEKYYLFNYKWLLSTVVGILFVIILLGFVIDVSIRAFKLAILRLISPVPIISYIDPKSDQNGAFGAWVKSVTSTYIDLFLRIAIVYFILFIIQEFSVNGIIMDVGSGAVGLFSKVFIILGLFFFAKEAPGFIQSSLGIQNKGPGKGIFSGIGKMLGVAAGVGGAYRGAITAFRASRMADDVNDISTKNSFFNRWVKAGASGVAGGISTGISALGTARDSNDHQYRRAMDRVNQMNASRMNYATDGSTWFGGVRSGIHQAITAQSEYESLQNRETRLKKRAEEFKGRKTSLSNIQNMAMDKAKTNTKTKGSASFADAATGATINGKMNYNDFMSRRQTAAQMGAANFQVQYLDATGATQSATISMRDAMSAKFENDLLEANAGDYIYQNAHNNPEFNDVGLKQNLTAVTSYFDASGATMTEENTMSGLKSAKGLYAGEEFRTNNELNSVREAMPRAKANADRGKHNYK